MNALTSFFISSTCGLWLCFSDSEIELLLLVLQLFCTPVVSMQEMVRVRLNLGLFELEKEVLETWFLELKVSFDRLALPKHLPKSSDYLPHNLIGNGMPLFLSIMPLLIGGKYEKRHILFQPLRFVFFNSKTTFIGSHFLKSDIE